MDNHKLNQILKDLPRLERSADYWAQFPGKVMEEIRRRGIHPGRAATATDQHPRPGFEAGLWLRGLFQMPAVRLSCGALVLILVFALGFWRGRHTPLRDKEFVAAQRYFGEVESLFPNQVRSISFDPNGAQLSLSEKADVPISQPLFLRICGPSGCRSFVTFSGQSIQVLGHTFEVLADRQGAVIVVGDQRVWSSAEPRETLGEYRVEARPLPARS
jgi:hypothetical protein